MILVSLESWEYQLPTQNKIELCAGLECFLDDVILFSLREINKLKNNAHFTIIWTRLFLACRTHRMSDKSSPHWVSQLITDKTFENSRVSHRILAPSKSKLLKDLVDQMIRFSDRNKYVILIPHLARPLQWQCCCSPPGCWPSVCSPCNVSRAPPSRQESPPSVCRPLSATTTNWGTKGENECRVFQARGKAGKMTKNDWWFTSVNNVLVTNAPCYRWATGSPSQKWGRTI